MNRERFLEEIKDIAEMEGHIRRKENIIQTDIVKLNKIRNQFREKVNNLFEEIYETYNMR